MQTTASQVPTPRRRKAPKIELNGGAALGLVPFALSHLADLEPAPVLRRSLRLFAMAYHRGGPALSLVWGGEVVACVGLVIEGLQARAWAFLSAPLCRRTRQSLFRAFARALPRLKRHYGLDSILVEAHPDHAPSREGLERLGFPFDGLGPRCPQLGERLLRYVYR